MIAVTAVLAVSIEDAASGRPLIVSTCFWISERASHAWLFALSAFELLPPHPDARSASRQTAIRAGSIFMQPP